MFLKYNFVILLCLAATSTAIPVISKTPERVSIEQLTMEELQLIRGIGPVLSKKIKSNPRKESIRKIKGMGKRKFERLEKYVKY